MLLVRLVLRETARARGELAAGERDGKAWGRSRPLEKRWSAGEFLLGSPEGESGVRQPNSKSSDDDGDEEESWLAPGVLGNEKAAVSPEEDFLRWVSMEEGGEGLCGGCMGKCLFVF